jgi:lysophospholipase L1-like esterase
MKPSPSRTSVKQEIIRGNQLIKDFLAKEKNTAYVDVYSKMLNSAELPMPELFVSDSLHMSSKGYDIWQAEIRPYLKK